jgi:hypothetical protein
MYAFPVGDAVDFKAILTFRYLKGMKLDESKFKRIVVTTISTTSAVEDSMRLLLILGLMDGVFDSNLKSWEDLMLLQPPEEGALIQIKPSMKTLPVFRNLGNDNVLSDLPETQKRVQGEIRRLRYACHFENRLTGYAWRRSVAYLLDSATTQENRKFMMGHRSDSKVFSSYQSKVSSVDLQALFRGKDQQNLQHMMSISLNKKDNAPTRISDAGYEEALSDTNYVKVVAELATLQATLCAEAWFHCSRLKSI